MSKAPKDTLLKEAIADAKAVKETALANAKLALQEAFTPKLQSMLGNRLRNEMEGEFGDETEGVPTSFEDTQAEVDPTLAQEATDVTASAGSDPEKGKAGAVGAESGGQGLETKGKQSLKLTEDEEEEFEVPGEEEVPEAPAVPEVPEVPAAPAVPGEEEEEFPEESVTAEAEGIPVPGEEDEFEQGEDDVELEAIIKELEAEEEETFEEPEVSGAPEVPEVPEVPATPGEEEEEEFPTTDEAVDVTADSASDPEKGQASAVGPESGGTEDTPNTGKETINPDSVEINLENIIKEIEDEMGEEEPEEEKYQEMESVKKENVVLAKSLKEHRRVVIYLRGKLNEINLLNAKLLFSNKLFRSNNLSESQKLRVIESIDRANTIREVKLVYATISEALKSKKSLTESKKRPSKGSASKATASTKPSKTVLSEGAQLAARFKKLAGTDKKITRFL